MDYLIGLSGLLSIISAWMLVVIPPFLYGFDPRTETISKITTKSKVVKRLVTLGLVIGSFFQTLFLVFLSRKFSFSIYSTGPFLFITMNVATILVALFNENDYKHLHKIFVYYYFLVTPITILLLGNIHQLTIIISIAFIIIYLFGHVILFYKYRKGNALSEIYSFFLLTLWTISHLIIKP